MQFHSCSSAIWIAYNAIMFQLEIVQLFFHFNIITFNISNPFDMPLRWIWRSKPNWIDTDERKSNLPWMFGFYSNRQRLYIKQIMNAILHKTYKTDSAQSVQSEWLINSEMCFILVWWKYQIFWIKCLWSKKCVGYHIENSRTFAKKHSI